MTEHSPENEQTKKDNPLLEKLKLPGKRFRLPSRGIFYNDGELDDSVVDGEVEVFSLSAIDEINLRTPDLLFSGEAISRVFKRCIPEIKSPLTLLSQDVDFLLGALRVVSYGNILEYDHRCPNCQEAQDKENKEKKDEFLEEVRIKAEEQNVPYDAAIEDGTVKKRLAAIENKKVDTQKFNIDINGMLLNKTKEISEEESEKYTVELSNGQVIKFQPMRLDAAVYLYQLDNAASDEDKQDPEFIEEYLAFIITCCVYSVDGHADREDIADWAKSLPVGIKDEINKSLEKIGDWGTDFDQKLVCNKCGHETSGSAVINPISFFM